MLSIKQKYETVQGVTDSVRKIFFPRIDKVVAMTALVRPLLKHLRPLRRYPMPRQFFKLRRKSTSSFGAKNTIIASY